MAVPVNSTIQTQIANLYIAILGRNPEPAGFGYWCDTLANNNGTNAALNAITLGFSNSPEFIATYSGQTTSAAVTLMYQNVLNRAPDAAGLAYWTSQVQNYVSAGYTNAQALALTGNQLITAAAANAGTADQTLILAKEAAAITAGTTAPTTTYTLTTDINNLNIGNNAVVNGTLANTGSTFQSFDTITGTGVNDTFNLLDSRDVTWAGIPASATLSGLTTVNLSRTGVLTNLQTNAVTVNNTTFGTGLKAFNLVNAGTLATGDVSVTLNSATTMSAASTGTAFTNVSFIDTAAGTTRGSTLTTVSATGATGTLTVEGNAVNTVNLNAVGGLTTINAAAGTRALTVNASGTTTLGGLTDAQATSATLNVSGTLNAGFGTLTVAKATAVTINATASTNVTLSAAVATTLNLGGTKSLALTVNTTPAVTSVAVTGSGGVSADLAAITTLTSLDLSGSTAVASTTAGTIANAFTIGTGVAVTGGAGNDQITVGATTKAINLGGGTNQVTLNAGTTALGTGGSINGGTGSADVLVLANADAVTLSTAGSVQTAFKAAVTGFEVLSIGTATATTISASGFGSFNQINFTTAAVTQTLSGVTSGLTLNATFGATQTSLTTNNLSGTSDVLNVNLNGDLSGGARAFGTFTLPGTESVNLKMVDSNATFTSRLATVTIADAGLQSLVITGNNGVVVTQTSVALTNFDASGLTTGSVQWASGALVGSSVVKGSATGGDTLNLSQSIATTNITAFAGNNTLLGSSTVANTITAGAGNDNITGGTAADTITAGNGTNVIYADNQGAKEVETVVFAGTTTSAATANSVVIEGITINYATGSTAALTATNLVNAIQANTNLTNVVSVSASDATVTATWLVDGNQTNITATSSVSTNLNTATITETTTGVQGTAAADTVTAGIGSDFIAGGGGNDVITGGAGADTFFFMKGQSIVSGGAQAKIADFVITSTANGDKIFLGNQIAVASAANTTVQDYSNQSTFAAAVNSAALSNATDNGTTVFIWGGNEYVYVETTGAGATAASTDFVVQLTGVPAAAGVAVAGNFILGV